MTPLICTPGTLSSNILADVVCEGIPARFSQSQVPCFEQVWLGQFHLGFKTPNGFMEVKTKFACVRGVACGHCHWCVAVQGPAGCVIVDLAAMHDAPVGQSNRRLRFSHRGPHHVAKASPFCLCRVLVGMMRFGCPCLDHESRRILVHADPTSDFALSLIRVRGGPI